MLASAGFGEEGVKSIISSTNSFIRRHLPIRLDAVLEAVELPACITDLDTSLSAVHRDDFAHCL